MDRKVLKFTGMIFVALVMLAGKSYSYNLINFKIITVNNQPVIYGNYLSLTNPTQYVDKVANDTFYVNIDGSRYSEYIMSGLEICEQMLQPTSPAGYPYAIKYYGAIRFGYYNTIDVSENSSGDVTLTVFSGTNNAEHITLLSTASPTQKLKFDYAFSALFKALFTSAHTWTNTNIVIVNYTNSDFDLTINGN